MVMTWSPTSMLVLSVQVAVDTPGGPGAQRCRADRGGDCRVKVSVKVAVPVGLTSPWVGSVKVAV